MKISFQCSHVPETAVNNLTYLRCCLRTDFSRIINKVYQGVFCPDEAWNKHIIKQQMLKLLMCVDWNETDYECLTITQLEDIANYILSNCPDCERSTN